MPQGVEHLGSGSHPLVGSEVSSSVMPQGVEHEISGGPDQQKANGV